MSKRDPWTREAIDPKSIHVVHAEVEGSMVMAKTVEGHKVCLDPNVATVLLLQQLLKMGNGPR